MMFRSRSGSFLGQVPRVSPTDLEYAVGHPIVQARLCSRDINLSLPYYSISIPTERIIKPVMAPKDFPFDRECRRAEYSEITGSTCLGFEHSRDIVGFRHR